MKALNFEEVYSGVAADEARQVEQPRNKPVEVNVKVAGVDQTEAKTVQFSTTNEGLVKVKFKEGGELPKEVRGLFTDINSALSAVAQWVARKQKEVTVDSEVKIHNEEQPAPPPAENTPESFDEVNTDTAEEQPAVEVAGSETLSLKGKGSKKSK